METTLNAAAQPRSQRARGGKGLGVALRRLRGHIDWDWQDTWALLLALVVLTALVFADGRG